MMLTLLLAASLSLASSVFAQSSAECGPISFESAHGHLFVEDNGNLTIPFQNGTVIPGAPSGASFYIGNDSSMSVIAPNGTRLYCHPFIWMQCNNTTPLEEATAHQFTIGSDGLLYVSENSDFYLASEFPETPTSPIPFHLYPESEGAEASEVFAKANVSDEWGWTTVQLKANGCYAGHSVNGQIAPTPAATYGTSANIAAATAMPLGMGLGAAMLGLAALA